MAAADGKQNGSIWRPGLPGRYDTVAVGAAFWWWGILLFAVPTYLALQGAAAASFDLAGIVLVIVGLLAAFSSLARVWQNEAPGHLGIALACLVAAGALYVVGATTAELLSAAAKVGSLVLVAVGVPFLFLMVGHIAESGSSGVQGAAAGRTLLKAAAAVGVAIVTLVTVAARVVAIVQTGHF